MLNKNQLLLLTISCLLHLLHTINFSQILKRFYVKNFKHPECRENSFMNSYVPLSSFYNDHFANFLLSFPPLIFMDYIKANL